MKIKLFFFILFFLGVGLMFSQYAKRYAYKGQIGTYAVSMYLKEIPQECGALTYEGMYRYDHDGSWIKVKVETNSDDKMVIIEDGITGVMLLEKKDIELEGVWLSPKGTRTLKTHWKEQALLNKQLDALESLYQETFEDGGC